MAKVNPIKLRARRGNGNHRVAADPNRSVLVRMEVIPLPVISPGTREISVVRAFCLMISPDATFDSGVLCMTLIPSRKITLSRAISSGCSFSILVGCSASRG